MGEESGFDDKKNRIITGYATEGTYKRESWI